MKKNIDYGKMIEFYHEICAGYSISEAAKFIEISRTHVYLLRKSDPVFKALMSMARDKNLRVLDMAVEITERSKRLKNKTVRLENIFAERARIIEKKYPAAMKISADYL